MMLNSTASYAGSVSTTDDVGRVVSLSQPAERVISLSPAITENLYSLGVADKIIATVEYSDYPKEAKSLPRVGDALHLNLEAILQLNPDLIIAWKPVLSLRLMEQLEGLGIPVFIEDSRHFSELADLFRRLGLLFNLSARAEALAEQVEQRLEQLQQRYSDSPTVVVFYQLWHNPLMTVNHTQVADQVIQLCGGVNPFSQRLEAVPKLSIESVISRHPQLMVTGETTELSWDLWQPWADQIPAVSQGYMRRVNADLLQRTTLRTLDGAEQLCRLIDEVRANLKP